MARKNGPSISDPNTQEIIRKYLSGAKLTATEKATIAGLVRMYPNIFTNATTQRTSGSAVSNGGVNVNVSNVQTNPYAARSAYNQNRNSSRRSTVSSSGGGYVYSPGGFKSSGRDSESQARRSGTMTPDSVMRNVHEEDGNVFVGKRAYNKAQQDAILKRGMSGATMNWSDQAVYDMMVRKQANEENTRAEKDANRKLLNQRIVNLGINPKTFNGGEYDVARLEEEKKRRNSEADTLFENNAKYNLWKRQEDYRNELNRQQEDAERISFNRRYGVPDDVTLTNDERKSIVDGKSYWGLSKKDKEQAKKIDDEMDRIISDPSTSLDDVKELYQQRDALKSRFVNRLRDKDDEDMTPQQMVDKNLVVITDPETGRKVSGIWKDGSFSKVDFGREDGDERWNGMTVKDFINAVPRKKTGKDENGIAMEVDVPLEDRIREGTRAWKNRESLVDQNSGEPVFVSAFDPINKDNPATNFNTSNDGYVENPNRAMRTEEGNSYSGFFSRGSKDNNTQEVSPSNQGAGTCPVCGAQLNANGTCGVCGYPNRTVTADNTNE